MCSRKDPVAGLVEALDGLAGQDVAALPAAALGDQLAALLALTNRLHAQVTRRVAVFDANDLAAADGARSTKAWLRMAGRMSPTAASRLVNGARWLSELPVLAAAAADGHVSSEHVDRVVRLGERVTADVVRSVERPLTEVACQVDPAGLEVACLRVRQHADPDGPRPDPGVQFDRRGITVSAFDGMLLVRGQLDPEGGALVQTALDALMLPPGPADDRTASQRRADALVELARGALRAGHLPEVGGHRPQIGILLTPRNLAPGAAASPGGGPATGDTGGPVDALTAAGIGPARAAPWLDWIGDVPDEVAQRVACDAAVWRVVLDPANGRPMELGRTHRVVPGWLRKALHARDRGCAFPHCHAPSAWTDAHHLEPWARGGRTEPDNLLLLCRWHHSLVHEGGWSIIRDPITGEITVHRPGGERFVPPGHAGGDHGAGGRHSWGRHPGGKEAA